MALDANLETWDINTIERQAAFLSQCYHESAGFTRFTENLNYSDAGLKAIFKKYFPSDALAAKYARQPQKIANKVYANRMGNGPEASGDGWKYRGRGMIQLTGADNYRTASFAIFGDTLLIKSPDLVATDYDVGVKVACWFWKVNNINQYADIEDIDGVSDKINRGRKTTPIGDAHGYAERLKLYKEFKSYL